MTSPLEDNVADQIYENYVGLRGKIARNRFDTLLAVFFDLTRAACGGTERVAYSIEIEAGWRNVSPHIVAFELWERFMINVDHTRDDATRVFQAVNAYAPYSSDCGHLIRGSQNGSYKPERSSTGHLMSLPPDEAKNGAIFI
jgi:hypothetical protein